MLLRVPAVRILICSIIMLIIAYHGLQIMYRAFYIIRYWHLAKLLKIEQAGVFPKLCIQTLLPKLALHFVEPLWIHKGFYAVPNLLEITHLIQSRLVVIAQIVPQGMPVLHNINPWNMVKP